MRKLYISALMALACLSASAEVAGVRVGYCDGQVNQYGYLNISGEQDVSAAIYVTPEMLAATHMTSLAQVNVGLSQSISNVTEVTAWVRKTRDGENLASGRITSTGVPAIAKGWNHVVLDQAYDFAPGEGLYIGYTYHQTALASPMSSVGVNSNSNTYLYKVGDGNWKTPDGYGVLCIEGVCVSEDMPLYDLALRSISTQGYQSGDEPLVVTMEVENCATVAATSFGVKASIDGLSQTWSGTISDIALAYEATGKYQIEVPVTGLERGRDYMLNVSITGPNGEEDEDVSNNTASVGFCKVGDMFPRDLLLEEFTTEYCGNCPPAARYLASTLESMTQDKRDRIAVVCHHAGYKYDVFTNSDNKAYEEFYGNGGTWAPGFMYNRIRRENEPQWVPVTQNYGPTWFPRYIQEELDQTALARVEVTGTYNADDNTVTANVHVERVGDCFSKPPRLTVFVVEDNVPAHYQYGVGTDGANYIHQHMQRMSNATWGVEVTGWDGNDYEYSWTVPVDEAWKLNDLSFVAFLSEYDYYDINARPVINSDQVFFNDFSATDINMAQQSEARAYGLDGRIVVEGQADSVAAYDLSGKGVALEGLQRGIYVVRMATGSQTFTQKVMVK